MKRWRVNQNERQHALVVVAVVNEPSPVPGARARLQRYLGTPRPAIQRPTFRRRVPGHRTTEFKFSNSKNANRHKKDKTVDDRVSEAQIKERVLHPGIELARTPATRADAEAERAPDTDPNWSTTPLSQQTSGGEKFKNEEDKVVRNDS